MSSSSDHLAMSTSMVITHRVLSAAVTLGRNSIVKCTLGKNERKDKETNKVKQAENKKGKITAQQAQSHIRGVS